MPFPHAVEIKIYSPDCAPGVSSTVLREHDPEKDGPQLPPLLDVPFFLQAMMNRMGVSYHKYGSFYTMFPNLKTGVDNASQRIEKYREDGNMEWLVDAANYLMMEFQAPSHPEAHFRATSSDESPGSIMRDGGIDWGRGFDPNHAGA